MREFATSKQANDRTQIEFETSKQTNDRTLYKQADDRSFFCHSPFRFYVKNS